VRRVDGIVVGGLGLVLAIVAAIATMLRFDPAVAVVIVAALALAALVLTLHRRTRRGQREQLEAIANAASQMEALHSIFATIQPNAPLPPLGGWAASADLLRLLLDLVLRERPRVILEASSGVSTLILAYGLRRVGAGGRVVSLEHDAEHAARTRQSLAVAGLDQIATVVHAPLVEHRLEGGTWRWYDLTGLPDLLPVEMLVVDGPPRTTQKLARYPALPLLLDRLSATATVIMDDARRPDEQLIAQRWAAMPGWQVHFPHTEKGAAVLRRGATKP
jgi:hypothetical protein